MTTITSHVAAPAPPIPRASVRAWRSLGVIGAWLLGVAPMLVGPARCNVAAVLHRPCPGCGMTRAMTMLAHGDALGAFRMHALALPIVLVTVFFAGVTVWLTWSQGTPLRLWESKLGRRATYATVAMHIAVVLFWAMREIGWFGGPVTVD